MVIRSKRKKRRVKLRKFIVFLTGFLLLCVLLVYLNLSGSIPAMNKKITSKNSEFVQVPTPETIESKVEAKLKTMSLDEKVGQLMMIGFAGSEVDENITKMISQKKVGGVILFDRNMVSPGQVTGLINSLQEIALRDKKNVPLFVAVDQEGGIVTRMRSRVGEIPSQQYLAQNGGEKDVRYFAMTTGRYLNAMGFNVNFAPVLDLSPTDTRSYSDKPEICADLGLAATCEFRNIGIIPTLKHFPGIGYSEKDPHFDQYTIERGEEIMMRNDLFPFKRIIEQCDNSKFFIMVSHLKYTAYDDSNPASLSPAILQKLLRQELGFSGIVVSDDLEMGALTKSYSFHDMGYLAIKAGVDIVLVCHDPEHQMDVYYGIVEAVKNKTLSEDRVNEAVKKILTAKFNMIQITRRSPDLAEELVVSTQKRNTI